MKKGYNNIKQCLNKGISTTVGILIVVSVAIVAGGIITWQMWPEQEAPSPSPTPYINIISPNGGEAWEVGETHQIKWESEGVENIIIWLYQEGGDSYQLNSQLLSASEEKYSWIIPESYSSDDNYKIQIVDLQKVNEVFDYSDNYFSIVAKDETADWKTYTNREYGFEFKYPEKIDTDYISIYSPSWPPETILIPIDPNFVCEENLNLKTALGYGKREEITVNDTTYCVTTGSEGTAGNSYITYRYATNKDDRQVTFGFTLVYPSCGALSGINNKMEKCEIEQDSFDPTILIDQIFSTFKFID